MKRSKDKTGIEYTKEIQHVLYYRLVDEYSGLGTPIGNDTWVRRAYLLYGIDINIINGGLTASTCLALLNDNTPIHMSINGSSGNHAVLLTGVYYTDVSTAGGVYTIMDPNLDEVTTVGVSPSVLQNGSGFVYTRTYADDNIYTFTDWYKSRY